MRNLIIILVITFHSCLFAQENITFLKKHQVQVGYKIKSTSLLNKINDNYLIIWDILNEPGGVKGFLPTGAVYNKYGEFINEFYPTLFISNLQLSQMYITDDKGFIFNGYAPNSEYKEYTYKLDSGYNLVWMLDSDEALQEITGLNDSIVFGFGQIDSFGMIYPKNFIGKLNINTGKYIKKIYIDSIESGVLDSFHGLRVDNGWMAICGNNLFYSIYNHNERLQFILKFNFDMELLNYFRVPYYTLGHSSDRVLLLNMPIFKDSTSGNAGYYRKLVCYTINTLLPEWTYTEYDATFKTRASFRLITEDNYGNFTLLTNRFDDKKFSNHIIVLDKNGKVRKRIKFYDTNQGPWQNYRVEQILGLEKDGYLMIWSDVSGSDYEQYIMKTDTNGYCRNDSLFKIIVLGNSNLLSSDQILKLNVFSNPCNRNCTFTLPTFSAQKAEFRLYNITGRLVKQETFIGNSFQLERGNLPSGMYLYHISAGEKVFAGKVLVE